MNVFQLLSRLHVQSGVEYFTWSDLSNLMKTCRALYTCFRPALHSVYIPYDVDGIVKTMARLEVHGWCVHIGWSISSVTLGRFDQGPTGTVMRVWWKRHANFTAEKCALARYWSAGLILGLERSIHRLAPLHDYNIDDAFQLHLVHENHSSLMLQGNFVQRDELPPEYLDAIRHHYAEAEKPATRVVDHYQFLFESYDDDNWEDVDWLMSPMFFIFCAMDFGVKLTLNAIEENIFIPEDFVFLGLSMNFTTSWVIECDYQKFIQFLPRNPMYQPMYQRIIDDFAAPADRTSSATYPADVFSLDWPVPVNENVSCTEKITVACDEDDWLWCAFCSFSAGCDKAYDAAKDEMMRLNTDRAMNRMMSIIHPALLNPMRVVSSRNLFLAFFLFTNPEDWEANHDIVGAFPLDATVCLTVDSMEGVRSGTPLDAAVAMNSISIVRRLLDRGAVVGKRTMKFALEWMNLEMISLLVPHMPPNLKYLRKFLQAASQSLTHLTYDQVIYVAELIITRGTQGAGRFATESIELPVNLLHGILGVYHHQLSPELVKWVLSKEVSRQAEMVNYVDDFMGTTVFFELAQCLQMDRIMRHEGVTQPKSDALQVVRTLLPFATVETLCRESFVANGHSALTILAHNMFDPYLQLEIMRLFFEAGARAPSIDPEVRPAIWSLYLDYEHDPFSPNKDGETPIFECVVFCPFTTTEIVVKRCQRDINRRNFAGVTALNFLVSKAIHLLDFLIDDHQGSDMVKRVQLLMDLGADPNISCPSVSPYGAAPPPPMTAIEMLEAKLAEMGVSTTKRLRSSGGKRTPWELEMYKILKLY